MNDYKMTHSCDKKHTYVHKLSFTIYGTGLSLNMYYVVVLMHIVEIYNSNINARVCVCVLCVCVCMHTWGGVHDHQRTHEWPHSADQ